MNPLRSILVPLDGSDASARALGCALWLTRRSGARLHILSATEQPRPARDELARLHVPEAAWSSVVLHQAPGYPERAICEAVARHETQLVVMTAHGATRTEGPLGHVTRAVVEKSGVPVVVLPAGYVERLPWKRALVPISSTRATDDALTLSVRLAAALDFDVVCAHIAGPAMRNDSLAAIAHYADAPHHEYPQQLEELVRRALPHCSADECRRINAVVLRRGKVADELAKLVEERDADVLIIGWRPRRAGRLSLIDVLIERLDRPVLLTRPAARRGVRLKVGEAIE
jgi:nucleotide-binding universal stress UspA family protein